MGNVMLLKPFETSLSIVYNGKEHKTSGSMFMDHCHM